MSDVMRELRRRVGANRSPPPFNPCLPRLAERPPAGDGWIHEIKHDGFRILAHRHGQAVRLMSRNCHDLRSRFPQIVEAMRSLPVQSCGSTAKRLSPTTRGWRCSILSAGTGTMSALSCAPSICSSGTARIYDASGLRSASVHWRGYLVAFSPALS
jgi:ATP dependent DNA ligase domain